MIRVGPGLIAVALGLAAQAGPAGAAVGGLPTRVGQCAATAIAEVGSRLDRVADSGSAVTYRNGGVQVSYAVSPVVGRWRKGDPVEICLVEIPDECPPGDDRGKVYRVTNLRTHTRWEAPDSEHGCGGA